jgi:HSP20 family molecular chaperone IbpA
MVKYPIRRRNNDLPQIRDPFSWAERMFQDMERMWEEMREQLKVEETDTDYMITVNMQGIEDPQDVHYQYKNGVLYLQRSIEVQSKKNLDQGMVWQSHIEHFSRSVPLPGNIRWQEREVKAGKGFWQMRIPKMR